LQSADEADCGDHTTPVKMRGGIFKLKPGLKAGQLRAARGEVAAKYKVRWGWGALSLSGA
jgi:hypothetical protein